jgi:hypothetical protein
MKKANYSDCFDSLPKELLKKYLDWKNGKITDEELIAASTKETVFAIGFLMGAWRQHEALMYASQGGMYDD